MSTARKCRVEIMVAIVAAIIVPLGFALSLPSRPDVARIAPRTAAPASSLAADTTVAAVTPIFAADEEDEPSSRSLDEVPDAAKLFFVGTLLVGLATAARKAA
jgi:hypothetical protein